MNVQQTIIKGIRELLFFHNYLVLPHFGGFVLKPNPSHLSVSGGQILPPSKTVSFNAQLKQNDGLLAIWLQDKLRCSSSEALEHLHDFAGYCSSVLTAKRRLNLDRIGFFYLDFENNICFEPQPDSNFLAESFGLGPVSVRELETPVTENKREAIFVDRPAHHTPSTSAPRPLRNYRRLVIPAVLSGLLFCALLLFVSNNRFSGQLRASAFGNGSRGKYQILNYPDLTIVSGNRKSFTYVADANGIAVLDLGNEKRIAVKVLYEKAPMTRIRKSGRDRNFEIVLGCFTQLQNASRMVARLNHENVNAKLSEKNERGMYVVSDGDFANREEAFSRLTELKKDFPKAWIKKRN